VKLGWKYAGGSCLIPEDQRQLFDSIEPMLVGPRGNILSRQCTLVPERGGPVIACYKRRTGRISGGWGALHEAMRLKAGGVLRFRQAAPGSSRFHVAKAGRSIAKLQQPAAAGQPSTPAQVTDPTLCLFGVCM